MKLIIDIPEDVYKKTVFYREFKDLNDCVTTIKALENGTPIPDNATNGDVIKAMFPNADIEIHNITVYVIFDMRSNVISFDLDWWNAPYQKGGKG